jgi:23S rRNA pseudouridine955/2504/2580 synthase
MQRITIGPEEHGCRIDRILRKKCTLLPLSTIYMLFRKGKVRISGKKVAQDYRCSEGDLLDVDVDKAEMTAPKESGDGDSSLVKTSFFRKNFLVLFEDTCLLACNKPSGLVVHPGTGHEQHDTLIDLATAYLHQPKKSIPQGDEIALVHRLDRDTSGVILIAKNKRTVRLLHETFKERSIVKEYRAICHGRPPEYEGTISLTLSRMHERNDGMKMIVGDEGQLAQSRYQILTYENNLSNIAVFLETGKTHQIRVQMSHVGAPIVGDVRYGDAQKDAKVLERKLRRLYLHAYRLSFRHPVTHKPLTIEAPVPTDFQALCSP